MENITLKDLRLVDSVIKSFPFNFIADDKKISIEKNKSDDQNSSFKIKLESRYVLLEFEIKHICDGSELISGTWSNGLDYEKFLITSLSNNMYTLFSGSGKDLLPLSIIIPNNYMTNIVDNLASGIKVKSVDIVHSSDKNDAENNKLLVKMPGYIEENS